MRPGRDDPGRACRQRTGGTRHRQVCSIYVHNRRTRLFVNSAWLASWLLPCRRASATSTWPAGRQPGSTGSVHSACATSCSCNSGSALGFRVAPVPEKGLPQTNLGMDLQRRLWVRRGKLRTAAANGRRRSPRLPSAPRLLHPPLTVLARHAQLAKAAPSPWPAPATRCISAGACAPNFFLRASRMGSPASTERQNWQLRAGGHGVPAAVPRFRLPQTVPSWAMPGSRPSQRLGPWLRLRGPLPTVGRSVPVQQECVPLLLRRHFWHGRQPLVQALEPHVAPAATWAMASSAQIRAGQGSVQHNPRRRGAHSRPGRRQHRAEQAHAA